MEWTEEKSLKLIEVYRSKTLLWDPKHSDHYRKNLKEDAWNEISKEISSPVAQCKKKMVSLLASNRREKQRVKNSKGTGK
ncbi:hypothetical protein AVEN_269453-1, partial [Araneus ventricosus]